LIRSVKVRNFQSLRSVDLALGKLTVIVGASSSGKSALMRSLRALTSNVRGTAFVTQGAKTAAVAVALDNGNTGTYKIALADNTEQTFTKLGGAVPEQVSQVLQLQPSVKGVSIHFAGQFDRPYLLDDSGAEVARELGELTNVSRIFDAVREANRRRLGTSGELKTRESDLGKLKDQAASYATLPDRLKALEEAEAAAQRASALNDRCTALRRVLSDHDLSLSTLERLDKSLPEVPSFDRVSAAQNQLSVFKDAVQAWVTARQQHTSASQGVDVAARDVDELHDELHRVLTAAGTCPTCGQSTKELTSV
jgi:DNA repair ATPase RecN